MVFMFTVMKKWVRFGILVAFALVGFQTANVFAETSVSDEESVTVTVHVLSADSEIPVDPPDEQGDDNPDEYPTPVVPDDEQDPVDVDPVDGGSEDEDETDGEDYDDEDATDDSDSEDGESEENIPVPNTSAGTDGGTGTPDTGTNTNSETLNNNGGFFSFLIKLLYPLCTG